MPDQFWVDYLGRLPEYERAAGLAFIRRSADADQSDVLVGLLGLHHAGAMAHIDAAATIAKAADAAAPLREVPLDLAKRIISQIDLPGLSKAIADGLSKSTESQTIAAAASATKSAVDSLAAANKALSEVAPTVQAHTLALAEAAKGLGNQAEIIISSEQKQRDILQSLGERIEHQNGDSRRHEWFIAALAAAVIVAPFAWWLRGLFILPPPTLDLSLLAAARGGALEYAVRPDGSLAVDIYGGQTSREQGWTVTTFPAPTSTQK